MLNPILDYLTFTIKTDLKSAKPAVINKAYIFGFLGLCPDHFFDLGRRGHYEHCYISNNISVYQAYPDRLEDMGFCVSMSGDGCRYYESFLKDGEFTNVWREFFLKLRDLTGNGCAVNVSRIDIAVDDYDSKLDLGLIEESSRKGEIVSQFRTGRGRDSIEVSFEKGLISDSGRTIYFGSRKSATYCRFYDKLQEQRQKYKNDKDKQKELENIEHWVRMEFEFKREQAVKIVNIICDAEKFGEYFALLVNGYIRFVNSDDTNRTRCTVKQWWSNFVCTLKRANLSVGQFKSYSYDRLIKYYDKYLTTTVFTILSRMSPDQFLSRTYDMAYNRLKPKHNAIMNDVKCSYDLNSSQFWDFMNPLPIDQRTDFVQ